MNLSFLQFSTDAASMSPLALFLQADIVVKCIMAALLIASIWTWSLIISMGMKLSYVSKHSAKFEQEFWASDDIDRFHETRKRANLPVARVMAAGVSEWRRSTTKKIVDREGARDRLSTVMASAVANESDKLSDRLNILATIGSVSPFVGLFGTVWGIMRSFIGIASQQNTSLAVVAPGIAEALFATAIGLFAAIPAVIAYNRFSHSINRIEARLNRFADGFYTTLSRELEQQ